MITDYGVKGLLHEALDGANLDRSIVRVAKRVESNLPAGSSEKLDFLGAVPAFREWIGARSAVTPSQYTYTVLLKKYEDTMKLPKDWLINDKTGNVRDSAGDLATRYIIDWPEALLAALLNNAASGTTFDGISMINNTREHGLSGNIDNNLENNVTEAAPTPQEMATSILAAYNAMVSFKDDQGRPINQRITDLTVICNAGGVNAPGLMQACSMPALVAGASSVPNPLLGLNIPLGINLRCIPTPLLTIGSNLGWFLVNTSPRACPFVMLENKNDYSEDLLGPGSDYEFQNDAWLQGLKAVGCMAYGRPTDVVYSLTT